MKKTMKKFMGSFLALGLVVLSLSGVATFASTDLGSSAALADKEYTLEEMLNYAIEDEHMALAEYEAIVAKFDVDRPFTNIIKSENTHIDLLTPLFATYKVALPTENWSQLVTVPASLEEAYKIGVEAEIKNIDMYKSFLEQELPADVKAVFEKLVNASENHLKAFERQVDGTCTGLGAGQENGNFGKGQRSENRGNGQGSAQRGNSGSNGQGTRGNGQLGECLLP